MRIGIVVALWGREACTRLCLTRLARAARGHDVVLVAVTDEAENGATARGLGFEVVEYPNTPLSDKHNAGALALRGRCDAVIVMGSDDLICDRLVGRWAEALDRQAVIGITDAWNVCLHRPDAMYYAGYTNYRRGETLGVARGLHAEALDALDWQPWAPGLSRGLDFSMTNRLKELGFSTMGEKQAEIGVHVVCLKGADVLTRFEKFEGLPGAVEADREAILAPFPEDERAALAALCTY